MATAIIQRLGMLLMLISLVSTSALASKDEDDFSRCERIIGKWAESSADDTIKEDKVTLKDLLFFSHIPRTGGRTYFQCFLKKLYVNADECPRSYDKLRFDPREPKCRLLVTHDDYSLMLKLPKEKTSVVTILRNPVDRVFSTYEFAVEVAARFLVHPNLTSAIQMSRRISSKSRGVSTLDIWPWKYLVPWMREDLFSRLAGLTNNSGLVESPKIRHCVRRYPALGLYVLEVAKSRLDHMLYIGLTEEHQESATLFANMVGSQVLSQSEALSSPGDKVASNETGTLKDFEDDRANQDKHSTSNEQAGESTSSTHTETTYENMTVEKLMGEYENCISTLRKSQAKRRSVSLRKIAPANFSKEARLQVPQAVLQKILLMNSLDVDLYKHAQHLFVQQQKHLMQNDSTNSVSQHKHFLSEETSEMHYNLYGYITWKFISLGLMIFFIIFVIVIVTTGKKASKIKV